jgi:hypothetical protein
MTYRIDRYNGTFLTNVSDGTIDTTTTDLKFVGRNYTGYGEVQNENFLHLLESFASPTEPIRKISGQIWYDSGTRKLKYYDGSRFKVASGAEVASSAPTGLAPGDFWFDSNTNQLSAWNGSTFVLVGPQSAPGFGTSQIVTQVVKDSGDTSRVILRAVVGGITTAIFSNEPDFTLSASNNIPGFSETGRRIYKGITLSSVNSNGVSDSSGYRVWGTVSNAERLGGETPDKFIRADAPGGFTSEINFSRNGLTVGATRDLKFYVNTTNEPTIENQINGRIIVRISNSGSITDKDDMMIFTRDIFDSADPTSAIAILPGSNGRVNLGVASRRWKSVYAQNLFGDLTGNVIGNSTGSHKGDLLAANNSTAYNSTSRQFVGDLFTGSFVGPLQGNAATATTATKVTGLDATDQATLTGIVDVLGNIGPVASIPVRTAAGVIRATLFEGQSLDTVTVNGRPASENPDAESIAKRTIGGNLRAIVFEGTSTSSLYADLAEIYTTDKEYEVGTVMTVGGTAEVRACQFGDRAIGAISEKPGFLMNSEGTGQPVALKGRIPVKVSGRIKKGDRLIAGNNGRAVYSSFHTHVDSFAIALEDHQSETDGVIEAIIL